MTIEEMKTAKAQAEAEIQQSLEKFISDTRLHVADISVEFIDNVIMGKLSRRVKSVTLDVRL